MNLHGNTMSAMHSLRLSVFVLLQHLLPRYWLTALVYRVCRVRNRAFKNFLIRKFVWFYDVDIEAAEKTVPEGYDSFNEFFTRALSTGSRQINASPEIIVSPVDGTLSAAGRIDNDQLFQAKGHNYRLHDLLATNFEEANQYINGAFATVYLAPYNYHRVHAPISGNLAIARYVPGELFSVNSATLSKVPNLFARNERLICHIETESGPMILIFVGALNVGSITTPWTGEIRPRKFGVVEEIELQPSIPRTLRRGELVGWFNMGSTVIMLLPPERCTWDSDLNSGKTMRMGEAIGKLTGVR